MRSLLAIGAGGTIAWIAFGAHAEVPLLDQFDLAMHETGHLVMGFMPRLVVFMAGSVAQVAFPIVMAAYFGLRRRDAAAAGFLLVWAGTSARDVSVYAGDAVRQALPLIGGGEHDWANILGANGFDALQHTAGVARSIEIVGWCLVGAGMALAALPILRPVTAVETEADDLPPAPPSSTDAWIAATSLPFKHERDAPDTNPDTGEVPGSEETAHPRQHSAMS